MDDAFDIASIVKEFLVETGEHLDRLDQDVVALEADAGDEERLANIFRSFHTIKGTCAWLGFAEMEALAHSAESLLSALREGGARMSPDIATCLLAVADAMRTTLRTIEVTHSEGNVDFQALRARLDAHNPEATPAVVHQGFATVADALQDFTDPTTPSAAERTVRVDVQLLDRLMNHVGELVLARNQIIQGLDQPGSVLVPAATHRLKSITSELQQGVMKARLQPIDSVWNKLPRVAREAARSVGKQVQLLFEGQETEVDRSLLQAIKDPLTHLVRNAVDHGIEVPEERRSAAKEEYGTIRLRAYHEGDQVIVEVYDDGAGLDLPRIKGVAVARELISTDQAAAMSERELMQLVFRPGFSTRKEVTSLSGRGVGLDVVKTHVERIGGTVDLESTRGRGMTVRLRVPLTLAIIQALIVRCGGGRYALPQANVIELARVPAEQVGKLVDRVYDSPVLRLRGNLVPLVDLAETLGLSPTPMPASGSDEALSIVIVEAARQRFGLLVDSVGDTEEIVVKPLSRHLSRTVVYSGATVMSDGKVGLILDALGLASVAQVAGRATRADTKQKPDAPIPDHTGRRYLLTAFPDGGRLAIPIEHVDRIEELHTSQLERLGARDVVQYRGAVLPIVRASEIFEERRIKPRDAAPPPTTGTTAQGGTLPTVIYRDSETHVGLVVESILDVVDETTGTAIGPAPRRGASGTIVAGGRVAEIIDAKAVGQAASNHAEREP